MYVVNDRIKYNWKEHEEDLLVVIFEVPTGSSTLKLIHTSGMQQITELVRIFLKIACTCFSFF